METVVGECDFHVCLWRGGGGECVHQYNVCILKLLTSFPADPPQSNGACDTILSQKVYGECLSFCHSSGVGVKNLPYSQIALAISCCSESM